MDKIRILIADDHKLVREGLKIYLRLQSEFEVIGEAADGQEAVKMASAIQPDVIIMDLNMPKMDGIRAINEIKKQNPNTRIIVLTVFTQNDMVMPAINAGADGYLLKDLQPEELISAIWSVVKGKPAIHPEIVKKLMMVVSTTDENDRLKTLTPREHEVLQLVADGKSNDEIANELVISVLTVKTHVHNILTKLDMTKRVQAALFVKSQPDLFDENLNIIRE